MAVLSATVNVMVFFDFAVSVPLVALAGSQAGSPLSVQFSELPLSFTMVASKVVLSPLCCSMVTSLSPSHSSWLRFT